MPGRNVKSWGLNAPIQINVYDAAAAGLQLDGYCFISDSYYEVVEMRVNYRVAGGANAALTVRKVPSATVIGSGVALGLTAFDLTATAATAQKRRLVESTMTATAADRLLVPGDSIALDWSGTLTGLLGVGVTIVLVPLRKIKTR